MSWGGSPWMGGGSGGSPTSPMAAGALITAARRKHPAFSEAAIPTPIALLELADVQAALHQAAQQRDPFYVVGSVIASQQPFQAAILLPDFAGLSGGRVRFVDPLRPEAELRIAERAAHPWGPGRWRALLLDQTLTLLGTADDWADVATVEVVYAPAPGALAGTGSTLLLPLSARTAVIAALAATMAGRAAALGIAGVDVAGMAQLAGSLRGLWLDTVAGRGRAQKVRTMAVNW